jgi:alcohol dehydrogenase
VAGRGGRPVPGCGGGPGNLWNDRKRRRPAIPGTVLIAQHEGVFLRSRASTDSAPAPASARSRGRAARPPGWVARPHGWVRHYSGLIGPAGATAAGVMLSNQPQQRLANARAALARRRGARQRGLVVSPGGRLGWRGVPAPAPPGPLGATVHPVAVATCDMDRPIMLGATPFPLPLHLGHECVAEVVAVGDEVRTVSPGDLVVVPFQINCGTCPPCRLGRTGSCTGVPAVSMYGFGLAGGPWGGALADLVGVPFADGMLVRLPEGVDPVAAASVADNVSDAYRHVAPHLPGLLDTDPGARVLILAGLSRRPAFTASVPLYAGLVAVALGARHVELVDSRAEVRDLASKLGLAARSPAGLRGIAPAPLVVDVTASPRGLRAALALTGPDGVCSSAGGLHHSGRIPLLRPYIRNLTLHIGRTHARAVIPQVLRLVTDGTLHPEAVTTQVAPLREAPSALDQHCRAGAVKTILTAAP